MNDIKPTTLKIKFPEDLTQWLFEKSSRESRTVSDIVRDIVREAKDKYSGFGE